MLAIKKNRVVTNMAPRVGFRRFPKKGLYLAGAILPSLIMQTFETDLEKSPENLEGLHAELAFFKAISRRWKRMLGRRDSGEIQQTLAVHVEKLRNVVDPMEREIKTKELLQYIKKHQKSVLKHGRSQIVSALINGDLELAHTILNTFPKMRKMDDPHPKLRIPRSPIKGQVHFPSLTLRALYKIKNAMVAKESLTEDIMNAANSNALKILQLIDKSDPEAFNVINRIKTDIEDNVPVQANERKALEYINKMAEDPSFSPVMDYVKQRIAEDRPKKVKWFSCF